MTLPNWPFHETDPADLPQGVVTPGQLGETLQNPSAAKFRNLAAGRFPGQVDDDLAGNPANVNGPLGTVVNQFAAFTEDVATADPADIQSPEDLRTRVNGFFGLRPVLQALIFTPLSYLLAWIVDGDPDDYDTLEEIQDNLIPALIRLPLRILAQLIGGIPIIGDAVEDALAGWMRNTNETAVDAAETVVSVGTQVNYVQQVIALQSGMGVWETGPDRTGTPSFPFAYLNLVSLSGNTSYWPANQLAEYYHRHSVSLNSTIPVVNATETYAPWATVIFKSAAERKVLTWIAHKTGTVSTFYLDVYKLEVDGSSTLVYSSPNLAGDVPVSLASIGWMQHLMDGASIIADVGDAFEVQFRMTGSGSVAIAGVNFPNPTPLPGFRPYASGSGRNPSTTPAPTTIPTTTRDAMYTGPTPFVSIGIDVGQTQIPRFFYDDFNRSAIGMGWKEFGTVQISGNRVQNSSSVFVSNASALMYTQPLVSDTVEVGADFSDLSASYSGVGMCCTSSLGGGVWLLVTDGSVSLNTGSYSSPTVRGSSSSVSPGRYTMRYTPSDNTYRVFKGDTSSSPIITWVDSGHIVAHGVGRRWVGIVVRRDFLTLSAKVDNFTAADIPAEDE